MDGRSSNAQLIRRDNGKSYKVNTHYSSFNVEIVDSQAKYLRMRKKGEEEQNDCIISPMPGKVVKIPVAVGQEMKAGDTAIVIEAMKMQSNYKVTSDCRIKEILVQEGDNITGDQTLITLEPIASVIVPIELLPFKVTEAPMIVSPLLSRTVPLTVIPFCADAVTKLNNIRRNR